MPNTIIRALLAITFLATVTAPAAAQERACAMVYIPVCAIKDSVRKTFSNAACAGVEGARVVSKGECKSRGGR